MVKIKNKHLTVRIDPKGAEIKSIKCDGIEKLWQGEEDSWQGTAPTLFPFCGGLKDGKFIYADKEYFCPKHGFAKDLEFTVTEKDRHHAVLTLESSPETLEKYPFDFVLTVTFTILRQSLTVKYTVKNTGRRALYFSVGSHESYLIEGGMENCELLFPHRESLKHCVIKDGLLSGETEQLTLHSKTLALYNKYLDNDSLVIKNMVSRSVTFRKRATGERIKIEFPGSKYFVIWSLKNKDFVCLEPWAGFPDSVDSSGKIEEKEGIIKLARHRKKTIAHRITFLPSF